jgi:hypothetical protein
VSYTITIYTVRDKETNEIFEIHSSFAVFEQALYCSPQYKLARIEYAFGKMHPEHRFELYIDK